MYGLQQNCLQDTQEDSHMKADKHCVTFVTDPDACIQASSQSIYPIANTNAQEIKRLHAWNTYSSLVEAFDLGTRRCSCD